MLSLFSHPHISKFIAPLLIAVLVLPAFGFLALPREAKASVPTHCSFFDANCLKEYLGDTALKAIVAAIVRVTTRVMVDWITANEGRDVGFIKNFEQYFFEEIDARAGEFLSHLRGVNLCSSRLRARLDFMLGLPSYNFRYLRPQLECTLTDIIANIEDHYNDFNRGGWPVFLTNTLVPQNNHFGAGVLAEINFENSRAAAAWALDRNTTANEGFKGVGLPIPSRRCEAVDTGGDEEPAENCYTEWNITEPGALVSQSLKKSIEDTSLEQLLPIDEISEAVSLIVNTLLNQLLSGRLF